MNENNITMTLNENAQKPPAADEQAPMGDPTAAHSPVPPKQNPEDYKSEIERLAQEAEDEAAWRSAVHETDEDLEREIEFGFMEILRDQHFEMLEHTDKQKPKYPHFEYLVDGLLPVNEVHVIAGETGAGKSTWLFDNFINPWQHEKPVLGRKSHWLPYVIFVNDRSEAGMVRTLQRLGLHPTQFPIKSTITGGTSTLLQKIEAFHDNNPALKVVFIEGLHVGQKEGNDYGESSQMMQELNALCQKRKLTIIATTHISKANAQLGAADRTSIIGSSATPGMCETVFVLTKQKKGGRVRLTVHPRNERAITQLYKWTDNGRLVETDDEEEQDRFVTYLNQLESEMFKTEDVVQFYEKRFKVKRDTAQNEINRALKEKWIKRSIDEQTGKVKKGYFKKIEEQWGEEED
jgi:RecA-family ATPase